MSDQPVRRAALRRQRESFLAKMLTLAMIAAVIGSGLVVYNTSRLILADRNNVTAYIPDTILADAPGSAFVMLTDGRGGPLPNEPVSIEIWKDDQKVWSETAKTDGGGIATPTFQGMDFVGPVEVRVSGAGEVLTRRVNIDTTTRIFLQMDKPIYQPGQTVHIRTLAFSGTSPQVSTQNVTLEVSTPTGDRIFRKTLAPNEYGIAAYDYQLGTRLPLGLYKVKATVGKETVEKSFGVQRYVLPRFMIQFNGMRGWYEFGGTVTGTICVDYVFGERVQGSLTLVARIYADRQYDIDTITQVLVNGCMSFVLSNTYVSTPDVGGFLELNATATDTAGHSEQKSREVPMTNTPILITALADTNVPGATSTYYVIARWADGTPVADASVTYYAATSDHTQTDSRGVATISFLYEDQTSLSVTVMKGNYSSTLKTGLSPEPGVKVIADKTHYEVGETAHFQVYFSGESSTNWVYYEIVARDFVITTNRLTLQGNSATFGLQIDQSLVPLAELRVYKTLSDLTVSRDSVVFSVGTMSNLQVDISSDRPQYRPGEDVTLDFAVSESSAPVAAALGVSIVDMAVYEVDERFRGLEDAFKGEEGAVSYETQVVEYVYGERSLPPDAGAPLVVSPQSKMTNQMQSSLPDRRQEAIDAENTAIGYFWSALLLIGLVGYLGVVIAGLRSKKYAAMAVVLTVAVPSIAAVSYFAQHNYNAFSTSLGGPELQSGGVGAALPPVALEGGGGPTGGGDFQRWQCPACGGAQDQNGQQGGSIAPPARVRTFFPETWYWNPSLILGPDGHGSLTLPAPDSITTWAVDAVASTKDAKFGTGSAQVKVFQDFFVEPDMPVAAVKNDTFDLSVSVFNYLNATQDVTVQLQSEPWFVINGQSQQTLTIQPGNVAGTYFTITATEIGDHDLTVLAGNLLISDAVTRVMRVDPRGSPVDETYSGRLSNGESGTVTLSLRGNRIPGSESALVRVQPSMTAVVLDGAENYVQYVSGCGEQSMSTLNIDVLAFRLVSSGTSDAKMLELEQIVNQGIQHEMQFLLPAKNGAGRGIVWFPGDEDVHPWLTSWGLITFKDAMDAGFGLDEKILTDMQSWLVSIQNADGSWQFPEWGIYEYNNPILKSKMIATTAYIARALIYSGYPSDGPAIQKAIGYVESKVHGSWDDPYMLALSLIVLVDGGGSSSLRDEIASRLVELKRVENNTVYWKSPSSLLSDGGYMRGGYYGEYDSRTSETTGYAVIALFKQRGVTGDVAGGVEFLLSRRNEYGGYMSTQDTVVALQALLTIGSGSAVDSLDVTVRANGATVGSTHFDHSMKDLTYILDITANLTTVTTVNVSTSGTGSVVYQVVLSQYIPWDDIAPPPCELCLGVAFSSTNIRMGETSTANITLAYNGDAPQLKMVLVTVKSGAGLSFDVATLDSLVSRGTISLYEFNVNSVVLYIQNVVKGSTLSLSVVLVGSTPFQGTIEGCQAQDLYDPGLVSFVQPIDMTVVR